MAGPIPTWHFGRHSRGLSPLAAQRHAQVHRDQAARGSRQGAVDRGLHQVSPRDPDHLRPHAAQHRRLLHTDYLHDQLHRVGCKAGAILGAVDRHKLLGGLRDFDPDLGRIIRPHWPQAAAAALLRRLYHPRLFMMASSGSATLALIAQMVMIVFLSFFSGACPAVYSEILPTRVRYTALSIGYNIAVAVFGGFAPFIATWLIGVTGSNLAPSYYLIAAATITFLVVLRIRETAFEPLR